jgi:hypothetical protein
MRKQEADEEKAGVAVSAAVAATVAVADADEVRADSSEEDNIFARVTEATTRFEQLFDVLADEVINKHWLVVCGRYFRFREVEFYVKHVNHIDPYVHCDPDNGRPGCWYFHKSGKDFCGGTCKGLDISIGGKTHHGGILIRSIQDIETRKTVEGPSVCVDSIIKICRDIDPRLATIHDIVTHGTYKESVYDERGLLHLGRLGLGAEKWSLFKCPRVGLRDLSLIYQNKPYRYIVLPGKVKKGRQSLILALLQSGVATRQVQSLIGCNAATIDKIVCTIARSVLKEAQNRAVPA